MISSFLVSSQAPYAERALYVWVTATASQDPLASEAVQDRLVGFCREHRVTTVFLDMYQYVGATNGTDEKHARLRRTLRLLHKSGIVVYALAGAPDWSTEAVQGWVHTNITEKVAIFNSQGVPSERFDGFTLDVEYWTDVGQTAADAVPVLCSLMSTMRSTLGLPVGCFTTFYLADASGDRPTVTYNSKTVQDGIHLLDASDHVVVGSYRNTADVNLADDVAGQIGLTQPWYDYAVANNKKIYIGCETIDTTPAYITFYGMTKRQMEAELLKTAKHFPKNANLGHAFHSYDGWRIMSP